MMRDEDFPPVSGSDQEHERMRSPRRFRLVRDAGLPVLLPAGVREYREQEQGP